MRDTACHLAERPQPFLLDDLALRGAEVGHGLFQFPIQRDHLIDRLLAPGDVFQSAFEMMHIAGWIMDGPGVLRDPDTTAVAAQDFAFKIRNDSVAARALQEFIALFRFCEIVARGAFRDQRLRAFIAKDAGERRIRAQKAAVERKEEDPLDSIFEYAAIFLLGEDERRFRLFPFCAMIGGRDGELLDRFGEARGDEVADAEAREHHEQACRHDLPLELLLQGDRSAHGIKADLVSGRELRA